MRALSSLRLCKSIFRANYKPHLGYYNVFRSAAARVPGYPDWNTDFTSITLRDYSNRCSLTIQFNSFGYSQDSDDLRNEELRLADMLRILPGDLSIEQFQRLGYRRQYLVSANMSMEALVTILTLKLLSTNEQLEKIVPRKTEDLLYRVDCADESYRYHFHLGPLKRQEVPRYIQLQADDHFSPDAREDEIRKIMASYPDVSTLVDIDIYRAADNISASDASSFVTAARSRVHDLATRLNEYLFSTEVK